MSAAGRPGAGLLLLALLVPAGGVGDNGLSFAQRSSLPEWVSAAAEAGEIGRRSAPCACLNPFYQRGDFATGRRTTLSSSPSEPPASAAR